MKKILVVDDDDMTLKVFKEMLKPYSKEVRVLTAEDGTDAVVSVSKNKVELVMTDIQMNVMDGNELMTYLKNYHPKTTVFAMSSFIDREVEIKAYSAGASECFKKPLNMNLVVDKICKKLGC